MVRELGGRFVAQLQRRAVVPAVLCAVVLLTGYQARMRAVERSLPYCAHIDEHVWTAQALRILKTGDLNPHRFTKPSVMVYLDTAGFALGLLKAGMSGGQVPERGELNEGGFPYYSSSAMIRTVRQLYVLLALAAAGLAALAGRRMAHALLPLLEKRRKPWLGTGADWVGAIAFILCSISPLYLRYSVLYLSVDIVGCFTTLSALAYFVLHRRETRTLEFAVIGGALIGFALGTKYNYYPLLVPALGIIWVKYRERRILSSTILVLTTIATFLVTTPYALLDLPAFAWSAAGEALHYTVGHQPGMRPVSSHYVPSGAPMFLAYGATVTQNFGPVLILLAAVGVVWCVQKAPLLAFSFGGYPLLLWLYMSKQRAFFDRNLLILQLVVPVFAALGIVWCGAWIGRLVDRRIPSLSRWGRWAIVLPLLFSAVTFPVADAWASLEALRDSRREATDWLKGEKLTVSLILVARELEMDPRTFPRGQRVKTYRASKKSLSALWKEYPNTLVFVPHFEGDSYDRKTYPPIRTFGRRPPAKKRGGMWGANAHVLKGNPKFSVVRLPDREEDP